MQPHGWYRDAYGSHDDRWVSGGKPTNLVRDQGIESYDEPPQDRMPLYPRGRPAGEQLPWARAGRQWRRPGEWRSWTVWLPGLLTLAPYCFLASRGGLGGLLSVPVIALLAAGLRFPELRRPIAVTLSVAFALTCSMIGFAVTALGPMT
jgi:hypothetical protein